MIHARFALHTFLGVLVVGTMWRMTMYHLVASPNPALQHVGAAGLVQY
jgi:hypothetical protein